MPGDCICQHGQTRNIFMCLASRPRDSHWYCIAVNTVSSWLPALSCRQILKMFSYLPHPVLYCLSLSILMFLGTLQNRHNEEETIEIQFYGEDFVQSARRTWVKRAQHSREVSSSVLFRSRHSRSVKPRPSSAPFSGRRSSGPLWSPWGARNQKKQKKKKSYLGEKILLSFGHWERHQRRATMGDDNTWVFDSLVGFLRGPVWNVPILTFIEHKSLSKCVDKPFSA